MKGAILILLILIALPLSGSTQAQLSDYDVNYIRNAVPATERLVQSLQRELSESNKRIAGLERRLSELEALVPKPTR